MTKLEELEAAWFVTAASAATSATSDKEAAWSAEDDAWEAYVAELKVELYKRGTKNDYARGTRG
tara:strand:- start:140 stop:331 length:192 start_codon:yes stop_codon:yes gene_type:complete